MIKYYIFSRNLFVKNFFVEIVCLKKKNKYIWINSLIKKILYIVPFMIINKISDFLKYDIIFKYDNIYDITNKKTNYILPIILEFKVYSSNNPDVLLDLKDKFKYFNSLVPFYVFSKLYIPKDFNYLNIKYLSKSKIIEKNIEIVKNNNLLICELV